MSSAASKTSNTDVNAPGSKVDSAKTSSTISWTLRSRVQLTMSFSVCAPSTEPQGLCGDATSRAFGRGSRHWKCSSSDSTVGTPSVAPGTGTSTHSARASTSLV